MLEGLEVNIIRLSQLENQLTIGAEYYSKYFTSLYLELLKPILKAELLSKITSLITDGDHSATQYVENGITYLLSECIKEGRIELKKSKFISNSLHESLKRSSLKYKDILVTKTGVYFGISAVIPKYFGDANTSAHVGIIRLKKESQFNPYFVSTFLNSKYGQGQLRRRGLKVSRPEIKLIEFRDILIPFLSEEFQNFIEISILKANDLINQSELKRTEAHNILMQELGLINWIPVIKNTNTKSLKESFLSSGRIDAEYYQPKYDDLFEKITNYKYGYFKFSELINEYSTGFPFDSDKFVLNGYPLIRISNIRKGELDLSDAVTISLEDVELSKKDIVKPNDLLLSMSGTIGNCCKVPEGTNAIINQRILRFSVKDYNVDALCLLINSVVCELQLERVGTGGVQTNISSPDIFDMLIPKIDPEIQILIANKIQQSNTLQLKGYDLIETVKKTVEIAIEQNEKTAIDYLNNN